MYFGSLRTHLVASEQVVLRSFSGFYFTLRISKVWNMGKVLFLPGGFMKLGPGLTFSWKRALGITKAKRSIAKTTGIPTSRSGRRAKIGRWMGMK
jgi:hypothetical protein